MSVVNFHNVSLSYGDRDVLHNVSFQIGGGEFVYLVGRTGAGKSSLLKLIYADATPTAGEITVDQYRVDKIRRAEIPFLRRRLGVVFQDFQLLPDRTISDNLLFVMKATGWTDKSKMKSRLMEVLMQVGLTARMNDFPHRLSGGEQQRAAIGRALINDPALLVADEPTGNLDPEVTEAIMQVLMDVNRSGTAILMATHAYDLIRRRPARTLLCADGQVRETDPNRL